MDITNYHLFIKNFNFNVINNTYENTYVFIGKDNIAKQSLLYQLLDNRNGVASRTCLTSRTNNYNDMYEEYFGKDTIRYEYDADIFKNVLNKQRDKIRQRQEEYHNNNDEYYRYLKHEDDCCTVLVDNNHSSDWCRDRTIKSFFMNGRCYRTSLIINSTESINLQVGCRMNIDYLFIGLIENEEEKRKIYEKYCGMFPSFEGFCSVYNQCVDNNILMVIDNRCISKKLDDMIYWYEFTGNKRKNSVESGLTERKQPKHI